MSGGVVDGKLWIFGGQDEDNNKLGDIWSFDPNSMSWSQTKLNDGEF
jgi:N-acetylneuraminic acid mutarotase